MPKIKYAIPSHRRADTIGEKTIKMLLDNGVDPDDIQVFISPDDDYEKVRSFCEVQVTPAKNVVEKFNYIHNYYPEHTPVVFVEDDIELLKAKGDGKNELLPFNDLPKLAEQMFELAYEERTKLWGISSNANPFYMKKSYSVGFKFVVANLFGFYSTRDPFLAISQQMKSDYERTLLYFVKYGSVCRHDGICAITKNYRNPGGLQEIKSSRARLEDEACRNLVRRFPHLIEINEKKSKTSMYRELKLKTQRRRGLYDWMAIQKQIDKELQCSNSKVTPSSR